jgi:cation transport regulator ChaC
MYRHLTLREIVTRSVLTHMHVSMYTHTHTHTHTYMYTYAYMNIRAHIYSGGDMDQETMTRSAFIVAALGALGGGAFFVSKNPNALAAKK